VAGSIVRSTATYGGAPVSCCRSCAIPPKPAAGINHATPRGTLLGATWHSPAGCLGESSLLSSPARGRTCALVFVAANAGPQEDAPRVENASSLGVAVITRAGETNRDVGEGRRSRQERQQQGENQQRQQRCRGTHGRPCCPRARMRPKWEAHSIMANVAVGVCGDEKTPKRGAKSGRSPMPAGRMETPAGARDAMPVVPGEGSDLR